MKKFSVGKGIMYAAFFIIMLTCIIPFVLIISISFSTETDVLNDGFRLIPEHFSTRAYEAAFEQFGRILKSFGVTFFYAAIGTFLSVAMMAMAGYVLAHKECYFKKAFTFYLTVTMFFSGGLVPTYLVMTKLLHLGDTIWVYIVGGITPYTIFVFRTYFKQLPDSVSESARIDGATEMQVLSKVIIPMSMPVLATFSFLGFSSRWNDYTMTMYYITDPDLYTIQYLLQNILNEASTIKQMQQQLGLALTKNGVIPTETLKFALCVLGSIPVLIMFPFFQRYYSKGMIVGSVKG